MELGSTGTKIILGIGEHIAINSANFIPKIVEICKCSTTVKEKENELHEESSIYSTSYEGDSSIAYESAVKVLKYREDILHDKLHILSELLTSHALQDVDINCRADTNAGGKN